MRRKHMYNKETRKTLCGHTLTVQEKRTARINELRNTNCKNCERMYLKGEKEDGRDTQ